MVCPKQEVSFAFEFQEAAVAYAGIQQTWQDATAGAVMGTAFHGF
jgi:hypothetical protein